MVDQFRVARKLVVLARESVSVVTVEAAVADFTFRIGSVGLNLLGRISSLQQSQIHSLCS